MNEGTPDRIARKHFTRNAVLYPWYVGLFNCFFWMPVFFLFFNEHLTVAQVLRLEAIYYVAVVVLEVPSGFFSDSNDRDDWASLSRMQLVAAGARVFGEARIARRRWGRGGLNVPQSMAKQ
jgi:hypothetical protein